MNAKPVHFLFQQSMSENNNTQPKVADNREDGLLKNLDNFSSTDPHTASFDNLFISIAGLIGAGKSTLCRELGKVMNLPCYYEPVIEDGYLGDFYRDKARYGFTLQVYLLNARFKQHQQIIWQGKGGIQDRTIYEDGIFAKTLMKGGFMEPRDYATYVNLFNNLSSFLARPNLIIFIAVTPEQALERINARARGCETGITLEYLQMLHEAYEEFITEISRLIPVIRVDWSEFRSAEEMALMIKDQYMKMSNIRHVHWANGTGPMRVSPTRPLKEMASIENTETNLRSEA